MADRIPAGLGPFTAQDGRKFAFPVGIAFAVLGGIAYWRHPHGIPWKVFESLAVLLLIAGATIPAQLGPVYRGWMGFAHLLSKFTTPIFMGVVYYLVITPISLLMRLFGKQPMKHAEHNGGFWFAAPSGGRSNLDHQF